MLRWLTPSCRLRRAIDASVTVALFLLMLSPTAVNTSLNARVDGVSAAVSNLPQAVRDGSLVTAVGWVNATVNTLRQSVILVLPWMTIPNDGVFLAAQVHNQTDSTSLANCLLSYRSGSRPGVSFPVPLNSYSAPAIANHNGINAFLLVNATHVVVQAYNIALGYHMNPSFGFDIRSSQVRVSCLMR